MKIKLHSPTFGEEEIQAAVEVLRSTNVTSGEKVKEFEAKFGPYAVMCNSGSSANLLAIATLCNPLLYRTTHRHLSPGDEVIVSALSWATTIWPLVQHDLIPVIVDIDPDTLNIDPKELEKAIGPRTKAIMPVHVYGNPCDMEAIRRFNSTVYNNTLIIIEDCCEALGADVGHSDFNTYSFYFSHHITTLEGGMIVAQNTEMADMLRILRAHGWTREMKNRVHYEGIDDEFLFITAGYNLRTSEVNAAIGLVQYSKLDSFVKNRRKTAKKLTDIFSKYVNSQLTIQKDTGNSSWFGFPVIMNDESLLRQHFENNGIETRPLICGNIARQPGMEFYQHRVVGDLGNADHVMKNGFSIPCHQDIGEKECDYMANSLDRFFEKG